MSGNSVFPRGELQRASQKSTGRKTILCPKVNSPSYQKHRYMREISPVLSQKKATVYSKAFMLF